MNLCRYDNDRLGLVEGGLVFDVSQALAALPAPAWPYPMGDPLIIHLDQVQESAFKARRNAASKRVSEVALKSPITSPTKLMAAPANYRLHVEIDAQDPAVHHGLHNKLVEGVERPVEKLGLFLNRRPRLSAPPTASRCNGSTAATTTRSSLL
jgi:2,4-didehydro-3-deoxy-L-rhamnonate hydrolase